MPDISTQKPQATKVLPIIYVLDVSGSMAGAPIASVNQAMRETMPVLQEIASKNANNALIKVAAMTFASNVNWVTNGLEELEDFFWNDVAAGGITNLGMALDSLNEKMSRNVMLQSETGFKLPVFIFMSDGAPTDDWEKALNNINTNNKWFINGTKVAIAIGPNADRDALAKVVGNMEAVISVDDLDALKSLIVVLSATASKIGTQSQLTTAVDGGSIVDTVTRERGEGRTNVEIPQPVASVTNPTPENGGWDDDDWT